MLPANGRGKLPDFEERALHLNNKPRLCKEGLARFHHSLKAAGSEKYLRPPQLSGEHKHAQVTVSLLSLQPKLQNTTDVP